MMKRRIVTLLLALLLLSTGCNEREKAPEEYWLSEEGVQLIKKTYMLTFFMFDMMHMGSHREPFGVVEKEIFFGDAYLIRKTKGVGFRAAF